MSEKCSSTFNNIFFEAALLIYRIILDLHFKIDVYRNIQSSVYVGSQFSVSIALQHIRTTHFKKKTGCLDCLSLNLLLKIASCASYECAATGCNIYKPTSIPSILPFYISFSRYLYKMKLSASSTTRYKLRYKVDNVFVFYLLVSILFHYRCQVNTNTNLNGFFITPKWPRRICK